MTLSATRAIGEVLCNHRTIAPNNGTALEPSVSDALLANPL